MRDAARVFTALDLEFTQPGQRILQVGWCVGNVDTGEILSHRSLVVNPHDEVSPYITNLTGITPEQAAAGCHVVKAYHEMATDHRKHGAFCNPLTWGGGDSLSLYDEVFPIVVYEFPGEVIFIFGATGIIRRGIRH
jgi:hypothetical protein